MNAVARVLCITPILLCIAVGLAAAEEMTLPPLVDATISEKNLSTSLGNDTTLDAGTTGPNEGFKKNRALIRFDVAASLPSNAIVTSASLTLTLVASATTTNLWFSLHKVLQEWSESAVTWTNRLSPPAPWNTPGAAPPSDYSGSISQSNLITSGSVPAVFTFESNPAMIADVQSWLNNPAQNFGWILVCELEELERSVKKFASSERVTETNRPYLQVQFTLPDSPLRLSLLQQTNNQFQFQFSAAPGINYTVLYGADAGLDPTNWTVLTNISVQIGPTNVLVSDSLLSSSNRFYRVLAQ